MDNPLPPNLPPTITLFLRLEPDIPRLTHQNGLKICSVRSVRGDSSPRMFKTPALRDLEDKFISYLRPHAPSEPWTGPVHLTTGWLFRAPQKLKLPNGRSAWKTTKPDTDNLVKTLKDCLVKAGFVKDDAQICCEVIYKINHSADEEHGVQICLTQMPDLP